MSGYIVPLTTILLIFGAPYLVIYLQGRRLEGVEAQLKEIASALSAIEIAVRSGRNGEMMGAAE